MTNSVVTMAKIQFMVGRVTILYRAEKARTICTARQATMRYTGAITPIGSGVTSKVSTHQAR